MYECALRVLHETPSGQLSKGRKGFSRIDPSIRFISVHLRGFFRRYFPQVWIEYFVSYQYPSIKPFSYVTISSKFKTLNVWILRKMTKLNPKIIIYLLAWQFHRLFWNKLAKNVRICVLKNSVEAVMSKSNLFLNKYTKTCWSYLNSNKH